MQAHLLSTRGLVLERSEKGESYHYLRVLSVDAGLITCMHRRSKSLAQQAPDLLDYVELGLERRSQGGSWFISESRLVQRFSGIGSSYAALKEASSWARLVLANAQHMGAFESLMEITLNALAAWDRKAPPTVVHLKALYVFCRDEGLPVKEDWLANLSMDLGNAAKRVLAQPSGDAADEEDKVAELLQSLKRWAGGQHYVVVPDC